MEKPGERWIWTRLRQRELSVPATSIFTRYDGVVDWRACLDNASDRAENIEIRGASHFGLGQNPAAVAVIADRLAQSPASWQRYQVPPKLRRLVRVHD